MILVEGIFPRPHQFLSTVHDTHQFTYFIYLFYQDESRFERISRIQQLFQKLSRKQD